MKNTKSKLEQGSNEFAFVAAHQLKTPLTAIRWYTGEILNQDHANLTKVQVETMQELRATVDQMSEMLNGLLRIGRIHSGRLKVEPITQDILAIGQEILLNLDKQIKEKKIRVSMHSMPKKLPQVAVDKDVLKHVLQNLVENAIRYSQKGKKINIQISQKKDLLEFSVKDFGIGIPEKEQKNIFKEFFRAKNAGQFEPRGNGLGLVLAKYLVKHWGGKIWFASKENKGSTFFFTLPLKGMKEQKGEINLNT